MFSSLISQITNALNKMNALGAVTTHQYAMLRRYLMCQNVKTDLAMRIRHFIEHCVETRQRMVDQKSVVFLNWLSPGLQLQLQSAMLEPHLRTCVFLSHLFDEDALLKMSLCTQAITEESASLDDVIFSSGMTATAMYFLKKGSFSYTTYFDMENFPDIGERGEMGPFLGEMTLLTKYPWMHQGMLRATRMGTIIALHKEAFKRTISSYPEHVETFEHHAEKRRGWIYSKFAADDVVPEGDSDRLNFHIADGTSGLDPISDYIPESIARLNSNEEKVEEDHVGIIGSMMQLGTGKRPFPFPLGRKSGGQDALGWKI